MIDRNHLVACLGKLNEAHEQLTGRDDYTAEDLRLIDSVDEATLAILDALRKRHE